MTDTISLYTNPFSRGRIAHWMLEEVGAPYHVELLDFERNEHKSPEYLTLNPMGKVPAVRLEDGDMLTESGALLYWFGRGTELWPANERTRAEVLRWMFF